MFTARLAQRRFRIFTSISAALAIAVSTGLPLEGTTAHAEEGWQDGGNFPLLGDPRASREVKDRALPMVWRAFPPTLRREGPNSNLVTISTVHGLCYESMVTIHPETEEFIPSLAKEWKIENNEGAGTQTFWFRINPKARWSDDSPVTAKDVYYSWWHRVQEDRNDPSNMMVFGESYEEPVIVDDLTIKVTTKKLNWRLFLYFGGMLIYPEKYIHIPGKEYLERYNWELMPGSGPYSMKPKDLKKGQSLTLTRRDDWWAEDEPLSKNTYNFQKIKFIVIRDQELEFEKFKAGELDYYRVTRAQRWVEDIPREPLIDKGWIQKRKIYNQAPQGFSGFCMNMRKPPFDDRRVRQAFSHLFNRERLMDKLFFNEYEFIDSYFPGRDWGSADTNPKIRFDPDRAEELLWEAGYKTRNDDGYLVGADGKQFEITLNYGAQSWERIWLVVREDYEDAGIKFNLKLIDPSTLIKKMGERQFSVVFQSWGALLFPNPETSWRSSLADQPHNNNLTGFKNERVDELCKKYDVTFDRAEQKEIIREVDSIVFNEHPYALAWYGGFFRLLFWDRFGHPDRYVTRTGDVPEEQVAMLWWFDPAKEAALQEAMATGRQMPQSEIEVRPWE